jgi:hypothetical protein
MATKVGGVRASSPLYWKKRGGSWSRIPGGVTLEVQPSQGNMRRVKLVVRPGDATPAQMKKLSRYKGSVHVRYSENTKGQRSFLGFA